MQIIEPSFTILESTPNMELLIEKAGRTCYKSEEALGTNENFIQRLIKRGHGSVLEHGSITVSLTVDRGISHELVRHRIASFSQESTRYVNYGGREPRFICPVGICSDEPKQWRSYVAWRGVMESSFEVYERLLGHGVKPEDARSVLPNALATDIVVTTNVREWRHIFDLRCSKAAHPDMRHIMCQVRDVFAVNWPKLFGDLV